MLNTLGMAQAALGDVEHGVERLRQAIEVGRASGDADNLATAYSNLADTLSMVGRTQDALAMAKEAAHDRALEQHVRGRRDQERERDARVSDEPEQVEVP